MLTPPVTTTNLNDQNLYKVSSKYRCCRQNEVKSLESDLRSNTTNAYNGTDFQIYYMFTG